MNKTERVSQDYLIEYFKYGDNRQAVKEFTENLQKSLDDYYISICGEDRQKMHSKAIELEKFVSDEYILCSTHEFKGMSYKSFPEHIVLGEEVVKYFNLFVVNEKLCIALPRGIVEIANPKGIDKDKILVCRIPNYPNREHYQMPYVVFDEFVRYIVGYTEYPPIFEKNVAYYTSFPRNRKSYTVIIQATENGGYAVYNQVCVNILVQEKNLPRINHGEGTAYTWAHVGTVGKSGKVFHPENWTTP